jgi:F0F1-type ATP synthase membrane subunit a
VLASVALSFLELLVAFIQAYIFAFLCALYIGLAVSSEH